MRTTVVIAERNGGTPLLRTLRRLAALQGPVPVIVVDNGSDDGTPSLVASTHPDVVLVRINTSLGPRARNLGVARACTPYIAFIDDDGTWSDAALRRAEGILDAQPRVGLVDGRVGGRIDEQWLGVVVARREAFAAVGGFRRTRRFGTHESRLARDLTAAGWRCVSLDGLAASGQVRPQLEIVAAIGADLRAAQDALESEPGLLQRTLLRDVRDVG